MCQQQAMPDHQGRTAVASSYAPTKSPSLAGDAPKRVVITGWESLDEVKKWQAGEDYKDLLADPRSSYEGAAVRGCYVRESAGREARPDQVPVS